MAWSFGSRPALASAGIACALCAAGWVTPPAAAQAFSVRVIDDGPPTPVCSDAARLPNPTPDVNRMPQAEVALDVSQGGQLAVAAKDYRYSPPGSTRYNDRVWNGLYLSSDAGASWRNQMFEQADPNRGLPATTGSDLGQVPAMPLTFTHESDPVVAFDGAGNLFTSALAFAPALGDPSAVVLSKWDPSGRLVSTSLFGVEADARLANDKNWIAVQRDGPPGSAVVAQTWRLFTGGPNPPAEAGGYLAISADGGATFGAPLRLPVPVAAAMASQFYQPLVGRDGRGRLTLYVFFTTTDEAATHADMHLLRADLEGSGGDTPALAARLARGESWTYLPERLAGLRPYERGGWDGEFRVASAFQPALDPLGGDLWVVVHARGAADELPQALVSRSTDGGESFSAPRPVDAARGAQLLPAVAARAGLASLVWYDARHDPGYAPGGPVRGIDVYYAEVDAALVTRRVLRLTPETQVSDRAVFTRPRPPATTSSLRAPGRQPHELDPPGEPAGWAQPSAPAPDCASDRYDFLGDYLGLAVDGVNAYAAWADLRDQAPEPDVCAGHTCQGNRNINVYLARIPR